MLQLAVPDPPTLSVTEPVNGNAPAAVGVPVIPPTALNVNPGGSDPVAIPKDV
jgi:hypothetical protein